MDQERASSIFFLFFFFLLFPFSLFSHHSHGNDNSSLTWNFSLHFSPFSMENATLLGDSMMNNSFLHSSGSTIFFTLVFSFDEVKAKSSVYFSTSLFFLVRRSYEPEFFLPSEKLHLNEHFIPLKWVKNGRNGCLTVWLLQRLKWIKKPVFSAKFNLGNQYLPFLYVDFSASKKGGNFTNLVIKCKSLENFSSGNPQPENYEKKDYVLGVYTPVLAIISLISAVFAYLRKLIMKKKARPQIPSSETPASIEDSVISNLLAGFHKFTYSKLGAATKNFHQSELLGRGLYASVYRATFSESNTIYAVKRFNVNVSSKTSFEIEAIAIQRLRHDKILQLKGWCDENLNETLLLYDYMPNKSLQEAIQNRKQILVWSQRYKIAIDIAEALVYLHDECLPMVIHGDVKLGNVMLDADFNPKLGDFGLAMSRPPYILWRGRTEQDAPECQLDAEVTEKIDVYLYGSMVLGLCCEGTEKLNIFSKFLRNLKSIGKLLHAVDIRLGGNYNVEEMLRLLDVGLLCLEEEIQKRPSMKQVLQILTSALELRLPLASVEGEEAEES